MEREWINDEPENRCFGCSPHNPQGLKLVFVQTGPETVECRYHAAASYAGPEGVIHGGIQAVLLDEVMGSAIRVALADRDSQFVTADFRLHYRRPVPVEAPIVVRASLSRREGRSYFVSGQILDSGNELLTSAEARWCRISELASESTSPSET